jgi:branched-chain amino acid aminotransferase
MNGHAIETMSRLTDSGVKEMAHEEESLHDIDASKLTVTLTSVERPVPEPNSAEVWGVKACTDHSKLSLNQSLTEFGTF